MSQLVFTWSARQACTCLCIDKKWRKFTQLCVLNSVVCFVNGFPRASMWVFKKIIVHFYDRNSVSEKWVVGAMGWLPRVDWWISYQRNGLSEKWRGTGKSLLNSMCSWVLCVLWMCSSGHLVSIPLCCNWPPTLLISELCYWHCVRCTAMGKRITFIKVQKLGVWFSRSRQYPFSTSVSLPTYSVRTLSPPDSIPIKTPPSRHNHRKQIVWFSLHICTNFLPHEPCSCGHLVDQKLYHNGMDAYDVLKHVFECAVFSFFNMEIAHRSSYTSESEHPGAYVDVIW